MVKDSPITTQATISAIDVIGLEIDLVEDAIISVMCVCMPRKRIRDTSRLSLAATIKALIPCDKSEAVTAVIFGLLSVLSYGREDIKIALCSCWRERIGEKCYRVPTCGDW